MATLTELALRHTRLSAHEVAHLQRLVGAWGLVADLSFADVMLYTSVDGTPGEQVRYMVIGQVRPTTSQTLFPVDLVGTQFSADQRPLVDLARRSGEICRASRPQDGQSELFDVTAVPVRVSGNIVAVMCRESAPSVARRYGQLERAYLSTFDRLARMVARGDYPFSIQEPAEDLPRVGDGVILLDERGSVQFSSPNANSALNRFGVLVEYAGQTLDELGVDTSVVRHAYQTRRPATSEWMAGKQSTHVLSHCVPLLERGEVIGGILLLRDVSELRRLDRLIVTKDTHIREIHHRVKNNLQTISSLLRLQARRMEGSEARKAIEESMRRVASIALVHETLAREGTDVVPFGDIARPILRLIDESLAGKESQINLRIVGTVPVLPSTVATSLALVLTELLQNVVDHAYPEPSTVGSVSIMFEEDEASDERRLVVLDDGVGLPEQFSLDSNSGLGLSIVRALVESELGGKLTLESRVDGSGTIATVLTPFG